MYDEKYRKYDIAKEKRNWMLTYTNLNDIPSLLHLIEDAIPELRGKLISSIEKYYDKTTK